MEKAFSVNVTVRDIKTSHYVQNCGCALFKSLKRNGYPVIEVYPNQVYFKGAVYDINDDDAEALVDRDGDKEFGREIKPLKVRLSKN